MPRNEETKCERAKGHTLSRKVNKAIKRRRGKIRRRVDKQEANRPN